MSEVDPFTDIDYISEYVMDNCSFDNIEQLNQFIKELRFNLINLIDPDYCTETSESSETSEDDSNKEVIEIECDSEGFFSLK